MEPTHAKAGPGAGLFAQDAAGSLAQCGAVVLGEARLIFADETIAEGVAVGLHGARGDELIGGQQQGATGDSGDDGDGKKRKADHGWTCVLREARAGCSGIGRLPTMAAGSSSTKTKPRR